MNPEGPLFHKPKSFIAARQTLYASIFLGMLAFLFRDMNVGITNNGGMPAIGYTIAFYLIIILLIRQMSVCKKWARTVLLILYVLSMLAYPVVMHEQLRTSMMIMAILVIQAALQIYALVLLHNKECNAWFNSTTSAALP